MNNLLLKAGFVDSPLTKDVGRLDPNPDVLSLLIDVLGHGVIVVDERARILHECPIRVPHGVTMFLKAGTVANSSPEAFAAAADRCEVFRIEPLD